MTSGNNNNKSSAAIITNGHKTTGDKNVTIDSNSNHRLRSTSTSSSSSSSPPPSPTRKSPKKRSITVKTSFNLRASHVFFAICILVIAMIPFFVFDSTDEFLSSVNAFFFPPILKSSLNSNSNTKSTNAKKSKESLKKDSKQFFSGGWRSAELEILEKYDPHICNIDKISVNDLTPDRFEREYRYKKPVIVRFPNGAAGWTDPTKWSRASLRQEYSRWTVRSGSSVEIVRKGGNGDQSSSFIQFLDRLEDISTGTKGPQGGSGSYMFDRDFYFQSSLPRTLRLPKYLTTNNAEDDSIFFLGASLSGVVFHKHSDTWNGVVFGRKRWFLYPSTYTPPGGVYNGFSVLDWLSDVYPTLATDGKPTECVQEAGEIFYLPEGWYHATLNLGDTIAFAIQKKQPVLDTEILFYKATDLVNRVEGDLLTPENKEIHSQLLETYTELNKLLPESAEVMVKLGEQLYKLTRYSDSLPWYRSAIEKDPFFVVAYIHMGKALASLKEFGRAEEMLKKATDMSPNLWDVYKEYGEFLLNRKRHADALPIFKKGTELMPTLIPFWYFYQQCQIKVGDLDGAEATEKVLKNLRNKSLKQQNN